MSKTTRIRRIWKATQASFIGAELIGAGITLSALADCVLHLGWGYDWLAVAAGAAMMAWGCVVYLAGRAIFKWTSSFYD